MVHCHPVWQFPSIRQGIPFHLQPQKRIFHKLRLTESASGFSNHLDEIHGSLRCASFIRSILIVYAQMLPNHRLRPSTIAAYSVRSSNSTSCMSSMLLSKAALADASKPISLRISISLELSYMHLCGNW